MVTWPNDTPLPAGFREQPADEPPVVPRDSATVVLLRAGGSGPEVFLMRRVTGMAFAGGMTVFPGGSVDARDSDASVAWSGPPPSWWAERLGCPEPLAGALVCAAVRETFEECGVLLAGPDEHSVVADARDYHEARAALVARDVSFAEFLGEHRLVLRSDLLRPWANWVTPEGEPRRFDTRFFLGQLPDGQLADGATSEAVDADWHAPAAAIAEWRARQLRLLPPTWATLVELSGYATVDAALAAERVIEKRIPKVVREGGELRVILPDDPRYAHAAGHLDP